MTENCLSQARARLSRATVAVFAAFVVLSTAGMNVNARHATTMSFVATDLGTLGTPGDGSTSEALSVNDRGLVVGNSSIGGSAVLHAFLWSERTGKMINLGTLDDDAQTEVKAIGGDGVVAGFGFLNGGSVFHTFVWTRAKGIKDIRTNCVMPTSSTTTSSAVDRSKLDSSPTAVNSRGHVVGFSDCPDQNFHAFFWSRSSGMIDLGTLSGGATSVANGISDDDVVVGESLTGDGPLHAFMWTHHNGMVDLGTLGGLASTSTAQDVNDDGVIVGFSLTDNMASDGHVTNHAFVWTSQTGITDIRPASADHPEIDVFGEKINGRFVIGHTAPATNIQRAFFWTQERGFVDIGTLDGDPSSIATGVNARGLVVGNSFVPRGASHAFVWSASSGIAPLPTPAGRSSHVNAITGDFIVGAICDADGVNNCHATLWKPDSHSHGGRGHDKDDDD